MQKPSHFAKASRDKKVKSIFRQRVLAIVAAIPKGNVMTYGQVAAAAGSPGAARAVGNIMMGNFDPAIPCHRVIRSDGTVGDYNRGGERRKRLLLKEEKDGKKYQVPYTTKASLAQW